MSGLENAFVSGASLPDSGNTISGIKAASVPGGNILSGRNRAVPNGAGLPDKNKLVSNSADGGLPGKEKSISGQETQAKTGVPAAPLSSGAQALSRSAGLDFGLQGTESGALQELVSFLKLPSGSLSGDLISFFRFFSLPFDSKNVQALWREIQNLFGNLASYQASDSSPKGGPYSADAARSKAGEGKKREAAALGAAAAADKGLFLKGRALREYAAAIGAGFGDKAEGDEGGAGSGAGDEGDFSGGGFGKGGAGDADRKGRAKRPALQKPAPEEIRLKTGEMLKKRPVLDFINRIPGKNGRWIVFPFSFSDKNRELRSSFRLFLPERPEKTAALAADIAVFETKNAGPEQKKQPESNEIPGRRWFFLLKGIPGQDGDFSRCTLEFGLEAGKAPSRGKRESFSRDLAERFGLKPENVRFRDKLPPFADAKIDPLRSINEEV